ncbi:MAG: hypothetical protein HYZ53_26535 [Planctomycetes bacterium]|nr:hypothetical protein [Planctomycetota bacterium]
MSTHTQGPTCDESATDRNGPGGPDAGFKVFRKLNAPALRVLAGAKGRIDERALAVFPGATLEERLVRELASRRALPLKEVFESFEFHARVRRDLRVPVVVDLCCGHGLTGLLFAVYERVVEQVLLCDVRLPASHAAVLEAVCSVAPWVREKIRYRELPLKRLAGCLPQGAALAAVHACGVRSDLCIDLALGCRGPVGLMPCCYEGTARRAPTGLRESLGVALAADVDRTYRLEAAGFCVRWTAIPRAITPVNRVLLAVPRP